MIPKHSSRSAITQALDSAHTTLIECLLEFGVMFGMDASSRLLLPMLIAATLEEMAFSLRETKVQVHYEVEEKKVVNK